jgi:DNA mismatch repair ATPase MutS
MTPFTKMFVCLKPDDLPGSKSRFEREIDFTTQTLYEKNNILVFIDELYHSTNPPDALNACNIYCSKLWKKTNAISIISTHLFDLVKHAPTNIKKICCPAFLDNDGNIQFTYLLEDGICDVSSVNDMLKPIMMCD